MKKIGIIILLICSVLIVGCEKKETKKTTENNQSQTTIPNPLIELTTKEELEEEVNFKVPTIEQKEIISYIAIGETENKNQARILYQDGSEFDMKKGKIKNQEEISGIYGAEKKDNITINKTKITIYEYEETIFGVWNDKKYSYSYSMQNIDVDNLKEDLEKLLK